MNNGEVEKIEVRLLFEAAERKRNGYGQFHRFNGSINRRGRS